MSDLKFNRVAFIGFGLIGSSLARVMKRDGLAAEIAVCARTKKTLETARRLGLCDKATHDPAEAVAAADLVMVCTPLGAYEAVAKVFGPALSAGTIVSDVGSVKRAAARDLAPHLREGVHLVPGHPVAGTEHSGVDAGFADLFKDRWCILTPQADTDREAVKKITGLWQAAGMKVEIMDADHHDRVLAMTSHLPHLIAYSIVDTATALEEELQKEVVKFSAGGFRDFTRIAASDPVMWRDIMLANRQAILDILGRFNEDLTGLQRAIRRGEGDKLHEAFSRAQKIRLGVIDAKQD